MGLIRKTCSIATLGIIDFRSQKELIRRAEKEQRAADKQLAGIAEARAATDRRLGAAEESARQAQQAAVQKAEAAKASKRRRDRRQAKADQTRESIEGLLYSAGPAIEERAKDLSRRARKAAKKAQKKADAAAAEARQQAEKHGRRAKKKLKDVADSVSASLD